VTAVAVGLAASLATLGLAGIPAPAGAGGGEWMYPVRDRYEPGQDVLMVGYTQTARPSGTDPGGPYYAWLRVDPGAESRAGAVGVYVDPTDVRVAPVVVEASTTGDPVYPLRATISFTLPSDLSPGRYAPILCNDPCTQAPGYLIAEVLNVGLAPEFPIIRDWPATEPAIRWLEDDALLSGPSGQPVTAADHRAGRVPPPPTLPPSPAVTAPAPAADAPVSREAGAASSRVTGDADAPVTTADPDVSGVEVDPGPPVRGDDGWRPLAAWLAGLAALALASGALVARRRSARHAPQGHGPAAEPVASADASQPPAAGPPSGAGADRPMGADGAEPAPHGADPAGEGAGEAALVRT
jgi:hypothetical protein